MEVVQVFHLVALKLFHVIGGIDGWQSFMVSGDEVKCEGHGLCGIASVEDEEDDGVSTAVVEIAYIMEASMAPLYFYWSTGVAADLYSDWMVVMFCFVLLGFLSCSRAGGPDDRRQGVAHDGRDCWYSFCYPHSFEFVEGRVVEGAMPMEMR